MLVETIANEFSSYFDQDPYHDTALWFDPYREWERLLPYLQSYLPLLVFDGSQLQLRYKLASRQPGERVVVYLPMEREEARFLRPYFYTARCYQASIARVLRDAGVSLPNELRQRAALLPALAVVSVGKGRAFWEGIANLKTALDRLIVDPDDTLLRLLADPRRTMADLKRQELTEPFFELVVAEFGMAPPEPGQEDAWGDRFTAHLCLVETYESAGRPESFPFMGVLPPPVHWGRCRGFLHKWQHHELFKAAFRRRAKAIDAQYPLGPWAGEPSRAPASGAFLNVEKALWGKIQEELAAIQSKSNAVTFAQERRQLFQERAEGFWAREGEVPGWRALAGMAEVILGAEDALKELDQLTTATAMVERYTQQWWRIDRDYRRFRVELDHGAGGVDATLKWSERIYHDYLEGVNSRFTHMVAGEGAWPPGGQAQGGSTLWDRSMARAKGLRALVIVDALRYELAQDLAERLETPAAQVQAWFSPVPSVTELGMAALLPGWPEFQVDYASDEWIVTPPGSTDNLARKDKRLAWLATHLGSAATFSLDQWLSTPLDQVERNLKWIVVTSSAIDTIGEGVGTVALDTFDALLSRLEQGVRRLLAVGCTEIHVVTDHGFLLREAVREPDKVKVNVEGVLKKQARYLVGRDLQPTDLPHLPVSGSHDLVAWFPRGIGCFVTKGPYNYMHGGIALQEIVIPYLQVQQSIAERLVGVSLQWADGPEIRNAIFKIRLIPEGVDLLSKARQVEIEVVKGERRVSRVWQERVERKVIERPLMLEPQYGLAVGDQVQVRVRDSTTGELLAQQPATIYVDLDL